MIVPLPPFELDTTAVNHIIQTPVAGAVTDSGVLNATSVVLVVVNELVPEACVMVGSLAMVMDPAPFVIVIPLPAVNVDTTGAALVEPISNCPFVIAPASTIEPPDETMMRLLFNVVDEFVPPFAMGNTPDT